MHPDILKQGPTAQQAEEGDDTIDQDFVGSGTLAASDIDDGVELDAVGGFDFSPIGRANDGVVLLQHSLKDR